MEWVWYRRGFLPGAARTVLAPLEALYAGGVACRNALYDTGLARVHASPLPVVSVGNLTVGGTGKTPVAAWLATELASRRARPVIVLRGYGGDETLVHRHLNPDVPVIASGDRVRGIARAAEQGAGVVVLDDAFQHRRAGRRADIVLVSADRWPLDARGRRLPAGPWREPLRSARRATLLFVTRKAALEEQAASVAAALRRAAPGVPVGVLRLAIGGLHRLDAEERLGVGALGGGRALAIAAVAHPAALAAQLTISGAVVRLAAFGDHHRFTPAEAERLARDVRGDEIVICTLKDAVKLQPLWPRAAPPLWYVSQRLVVESGQPAVDSLLAALTAARDVQP